MHHVSDMAAETLGKNGLGKTQTLPVLIKSLKDGLESILSAVTNVTLILLYRMVIAVIAVRLIEATPSDSQSSSQTVAVTARRWTDARDCISRFCIDKNIAS